MQILECDNVTKVFRSGLRGRVRALDHVGLTVQQGEIFGLLGPNGAGKTTLVKILLGLVHPTEGRALVFGKDARDWRARRQVGYLPENPNLPPYLTGEQVMRLFGGLSNMAPGESRRSCVELLEKVNLTDGGERKVRGYSKGMLQRIGLAQALVQDPDMIFLDEPTDGVDPLGRHEIREILAGLRDAGKTIFVNSHLLSEIEMLCDRVAIMDKGRILSEGSLDELTAESDNYAITCRHTETFDATLLDGCTLNCTTNNGLLEVSVKSIEQLNKAIDILRREQVMIEQITPARQSLESYFVNLITDIRGEQKSA